MQTQGIVRNGSSGITVLEGTLNLNTSGGDGVSNLKIQGATAVVRYLQFGQIGDQLNILVDAGTYDLGGFSQGCRTLTYNGGNIINFSQGINCNGTDTTLTMRNTSLSGPLQISLAGATVRFDATNNGTALIDGTLVLGSGGQVKFDIDNGGALTDMLIQSDISGGGIEKIGLGTLVLEGANTYSEGTTINAGTLGLGGTGTLLSTGPVEVGGGATFDISASAISHTIGDLSGAAGSQISLGANQLTFGTSNTTAQIFAGAISGAGGIVKQGSGIAIFSGANTYGGATAINGGTLNVTGSIGGSTTNVNAGTILNVAGTVSSTTTNVNSGALLTGTGTTGTLNNSGIVSPGNSIGTITIIGNYTQNLGADLAIEINDDGTSDRLDITGNASLAGTLTLTPQTGVYAANSLFRFMNFASRAGSLTLIDNSSLGFSIFYGPTFGELVNFVAGAVLPVPKRLLKGNPLAVADYLFCLGHFPSNPDLLKVMRALVDVAPADFAKDLVKLSPIQFGALPLANLQSHRLVSDVIVENTEKFYWCDPCNTQESTSEKCKNEKKRTSIWIAPIGDYYEQDGINKRPSQDWADRQIGFDTYSVGVGLGASHLFFDCFHVGGGLGYTYSHIDWDKSRGDGHWNSIYFGPSLGFSKSNGYVNLLLLGSYNYYHIDRNIHFSGLSRTASNKHHSYDILARVDGGYKFRINTGGNLGYFYLLPEARISYLNIFEESYRESGADSINLAVDSKYSAFLQPTVLVKFLRDFYRPGFCVTPTIQIGWISNIPLSSGNYQSKFYGQSTCQPHFVVKSYHDTTNQMTIGGEVVIRTDSNWIVEVGYKTDFFDNSFVQNWKLKLEKRF